MDDIDSKELEELMKELEKVKSDSIEIFNNLGLKNVKGIQEEVKKNRDQLNSQLVNNVNSNNEKIVNKKIEKIVSNNTSNNFNNLKAINYKEDLEKNIETILLKINNLENNYNIFFQELKIVNNNIDQVNSYLKNKFLHDYKFEKIVVKSLLELIKLNHEIINMVKYNIEKIDNKDFISHLEEIKKLLVSLENNIENKTKKEAELLDTIIRLLSIK